MRASRQGWSSQMALTPPLRVLSSPDFQSSDVIGVIDRTIDRAKLDQIGGTANWDESVVLPRGQ